MKSIVGKILRGRYFIVRELGKSGLIITYLAENRENSRHQHCLIKQLQPQTGSRLLDSKSESWQNLEKLFVTEAIKLKRVGKHPQVPQLFDYFEHENQFYFVFDFIEGKDLKQEIQAKTFSESEVINFLQDALKILDFIHQQGVIHRNLRPSNFIRGLDGSVFLINFGLIKNLTLPVNNSEADLPTVVLATSFYTAPEQMQGNPKYNSDIYALGKTAIYAFVGQVPNAKVASPKHFFQEEKIDLAGFNFSTRLTNILRKMLEPDYRKRYQSAVEVLTELEREENVITLPPPFVVSPTAAKITPQIVLNKQKKLFSKKIVVWIILLLPFLGALLLLIAGIKKNFYRNYSLYTNNQYNLEIKYPKTWSVQKLEDPITGEVVVFSSPLESNADLFQEKVSVTVEDVAKDFDDLNEYSNKIINDLSSNRDSTLSIYKQSKTKLAHQPARTLLYSRVDKGINLRQMETYTINNNKIYIVTYTAERAKYSKFLDTAKKIISSFRLTKN